MTHKDLAVRHMEAQGKPIPGYSQALPPIYSCDRAGDEERRRDEESSRLKLSPISLSGEVAEKEVSPATCPHSHKLNVVSGNHTSVESSGDYYVQICQDCGTFIVFARENGQVFNLKFNLPIQEQVEAAGIWSRYLGECLKRGE